MSGRYLTDLAAVLRAAGLNVIEQSGWQQRARSSGGYSSGRPLCVMWHHTASGASTSAKADTDYMSHGASAAPIANIMIARNGDVWVLAAGATNTNGDGVALQFSRGTVPAGQMNTHAIGMEIQNTGVGQAYSVECVDAAMRTSLACAAAYGLAPADVAGHWDYSGPRKIDPATAAAVQGPWRPRSVNGSGSWSLADLRAELNRRAAVTPPDPRPPDPIPPTPDPEEDLDMAFIITNRETGEVALVYGDRQVIGLAGQDLSGYQAQFGPPIPTDPVVWSGFISKSQ